MPIANAVEIVTSIYNMVLINFILRSPRHRVG